MDRQEHVNEQGFNFALGVSLFIHLAVIGVAYVFSFNSAKNTALAIEPDSRPSIEVLFVKRNPQQSSVVIEENIQALIQEQIQEQDQLASFFNEEQDATAGDDESVNNLSESRPSSATEGFSSAELNASLNSYMQSYRQEINQNWLEECARFKNQSSLEECPLGQEYVASLNPVCLQAVTQSEPDPLAAGEFSARESFELMTEEDLFNPHMLSREISLFGTSGGIVNNAVDFLASFIGIQKQNKPLFMSMELAEDSIDANANIDATEITEENIQIRTDFVVRPALF